MIQGNATVYRIQKFLYSMLFLSPLLCMGMDSLKDQCIKKIIKEKLVTPQNIYTLPIELLRPIILVLVASKALIKEKKPVFSWKGHTYDVVYLASFEGEEGLRIVSGDNDGSIKLWNQSGKEIAACNGSGYGHVRSVYKLPTDKGCVLVVEHAKKVSIWGLKGNLLGAFNLPSITSFICPVKVEEHWYICENFLKEMSGISDIRYWDLQGKQVGQMQSQQMRNQYPYQVAKQQYSYTSLYKQYKNFALVCRNMGGIAMYDNKYYSVLGFKPMAILGDAYKYGYNAVNIIEVKDKPYVIAGCGQDIQVWDTLEVLDTFNLINYEQSKGILGTLAGNKKDEEKYKDIKEILFPISKFKNNRFLAASLAYSGWLG